MSTTTAEHAFQDHLNGQSAFILVVFVIVSFFVIFPVRIPLLGFLQRALLRTLRVTRILDPSTVDTLSRRRLHFPLSLETAPLIGVLLLLAATTIDGSTIKLGVKGDANVKPYDVLVLFISLAYIAIALDGTGALEAVAFWVSRKGGNSGPRLFAYLYVFFLLTGCIVGNDPLILSGTPFLAYLTKYTNLEPTAWIFSEFMAANTASAVLVSSNPTNILITGSFGLNYLTGFTKWTVLPSIVPGILNYAVLYLMFRNRIPKTLTPLTDDPWSKLRDPKGAFFLSGLMLVTIAVLVGTSFVPGNAVQVWMVTAPAGISALAFNIISDLVNPKREQLLTDKESTDPAAEHTILANKPTLQPTSPLSTKPPQPNTNTNTNTTPQDSSDTLTEKTPDPQPDTVSPSTPTHKTLQSHLQTLTHRLPSTTQTITRLPLPLLPFAISEFILIRGLSQRGWITTFAHGFAHACHTPTTTVFFIGFVSAAFLCPFAGTNIGATILLVEILQDPAFSSSAAVTSDPKILTAAIYATALGSNLGAFSYVFAASLAGLLWRGLLEQKGVVVSLQKFFVVNLGPLLIQTTVACAIILGEVYWFA